MISAKAKSMTAANANWAAGHAIAHGSSPKTTT
jgi:hypothetical protein